MASPSLDGAGGVRPLPAGLSAGALAVEGRAGAGSVCRGGGEGVGRDGGPGAGPERPRTKRSAVCCPLSTAYLPIIRYIDARLVTTSLPFSTSLGSSSAAVRARPIGA